MFISAPFTYTFPGVLFVFCYTVLTIFIPLGPFPIGLVLFYLAWPVFYTVTSNPLIGLFAITSIVFVKLLIYKLLSGTDFMVISASKLQAWVSVFFVVGSVSFLTVSLLYETSLLYDDIVHIVITYIYLGVALSFPIDLMLLSYTKYRDSLRGKASLLWLIALPILWLLILFLVVIVFPYSTSWVMNMFSIPYTYIQVRLFVVWILILVMQVTMHLKLYYCKRAECFKTSTV